MKIQVVLIVLVHVVIVNSLLKDLKGRFPALDGNKLPFTIDMDVTKFNSDLRKIIMEDIAEEIEAKFQAYVKSTDFKELIETSSAEEIKRLTDPPKYKDCTDVKSRVGKDLNDNMIITIYPHNAGVEVYCDRTTDTGGWTVIQRRTNADLSFDRSWSDYENGFGNVTGDYWLGNKHIHSITANGKYELRMDLEMLSGGRKTVVYKTFNVGDTKSKYQLTATDFSGNSGDDHFSYLNGQKFTTKDQDNDNCSKNSAIINGGGWWYDGCYSGYLNGVYGTSEFRWNSYLRTSVMMIRKI